MSQIRKVMTTDVVFVDSDDRVEHAIELMLRHKISGLPVVCSHGDLLGLVTELDIIDMLEDPLTEKNKVYHYMTRDVITVDIDMSLHEVAHMFRTTKLHRFPVMENGRMVGIISRRELIRGVHQARVESGKHATLFREEYRLLDAHSDFGTRV